MAESICESFQATAARLLDLGLGYLSLDREAATLSTGERQRVQLARSVRNRTTGVLYVLDEPSIGLHPSNIEGLRGVMHDLIADGNSIVLVDHDTEILRDADWLIEMGPGAGENGGTILTQALWSRWPKARPPASGPSLPTCTPSQPAPAPRKRSSLRWAPSPCAPGPSTPSSRWKSGCPRGGSLQ